MKWALPLILLSLAACGVDGEPVQPNATGTVKVTNNGVKLGGSLGVTQGPLTIGLGF